MQCRLLLEHLEAFQNNKTLNMGAGTFPEDPTPVTPFCPQWERARAGIMFFQMSPHLIYRGEAWSTHGSLILLFMIPRRFGVYS
jgi:hypothetical protein